MVRPAKVDSQTEAVLKRLEALAERAPELAEPVAFYRAALPALRQAQADVPPFSLDPETAQRKLESGLPLLVGEDLPLDGAAMRDLFLRLCRTTESAGVDRTSPPRPAFSFLSRGRSGPLQSSGSAYAGDGSALRAAAAERIRRAVERDQLDLLSVWEALAAGDWPRVERAAADLQLDAGLLRLLAENSLKPSLRAWSRGLQDRVDLDRWRRGSCPMCGNSPTLSEIQGKEGERRLRCGACGADWHYPRLQCAFCGNSNHKTLGTISVEGEEEKYYAQTCDECRGYSKVVVTFDPTPVDLLAVEDLATLHFDLIAAERGYMRAPVR